MNLRCYFHPEALHPTSRYVDALVGSRANPDEVIMHLIGGVPADLTAPGRDYDEILSDPRMQWEVDPSSPDRIVTSCRTSNGVAYPARRMVEVARDVDARGGTALLSSICGDDLTPALERLAMAIRSRMACHN